MVLRIDDTKYETGYYEKGKKEGVWTTYSSKWQTTRMKLVLEEKTYKKGVLTSHVIYNKIENFTSVSKLQEAIEGRWYNTGWGTFDRAGHVDGSYVYIFSRDSSKFRSSGLIILDQLNLKNNGTFDKVSRYWCGTGGSNYDESSRLKEWHITEEMDLFLDGGTYNLVFINEETMVLTFKLKKSKKRIFKK